MTHRIFVSYRREDSAGYAGRLYDHLRQHYPADSIFMDVTRIRLGVDFAQAISDAISHCDVMVVVIGPKWLNIRDPGGRPRIEQPNDFVRLEILTAIKRRIRLMVILVDGAAAPDTNSLPEELRELSAARCLSIRENNWDTDVRSLLAELQGAQPEKKQFSRRLVIGTGAVAVLGAIKFFYPSGKRVEQKTDARVPKAVKPDLSVKAPAVRASALLSDGRIASASADGLLVWTASLATHVPLFGETGDDPLAVLALPGIRLAWGSRSGAIHIGNPGATALPATLTAHAAPVVSLALLGDGRLASGSWDRSVCIWNLSSGKVERTLNGHTNQVRALSALPDARLASASADGTIMVWNLATQAEAVKTLNRRGSPVNALVRLSDSTIAASADDGSIEVWNWITGDRQATIRAHRDSINALAILPDGRLASASDDHTIAIWNSKKSDLDARLTGHMERVTSLVVMPDGHLLSGSDDQTLKLWTCK